MDQNLNKVEIKDKLISIFNDNKTIIYSIIGILAIILLSISFFKINSEKENNLVAEKYIKAGLYLAEIDKIGAIEDADLDKRAAELEAMLADPDSAAGPDDRKELDAINIVFTPLMHFLRSTNLKMKIVLFDELFSSVSVSSLRVSPNLLVFVPGIYIACV